MAIDIDDELQEPIPEPHADDQRRKARLIGWGASVIIHASAVSLMAGVYFLHVEAEAETPPVRVSTIDPPVQPEIRQEPRERVLTTAVQIDTGNTESDNPNPISALDVPTELSESQTDDSVATDQARGREEAVSMSEMGGTGAFLAIGAGGGGSGMFGNRSGGGKKRAIAAGGGSRASESAVDAALRWFKRHQDPDGSWVASSYWRNCQEGPKCEPGRDYPSGDCTAGLTGYAVLSFLGAGYDHRTPSKYRETVQRGIEWLLRAQRPDGSIGNGARNYEHPIAVMALAEAFAMTQDRLLQTPTQRGVDVILARQNLAGNPAADARRDRLPVPGSTSGRLGWDYLDATTRNDGSVTGWNVMALKSALAAGLNIGQGMRGSEHYLVRTWRATNSERQLINGVTFKPWPEITAYDQSRFPYVWNTGEERLNPGNGHVNLASVGLVVGVFVGRTAGDPMIESLANWVLANQVPTTYPCNTYYLYYNTLALFQVGGDKWAQWNTRVKDLLVKSQRQTQDCFDGSWDNGIDFHGADVGRVLHTAYNTLSLQVYYRYAQIRAQGAR